MKTSADQPHAPARRLRTTPEHGAASASPSCQEHFSPEREVPNQKEFSIRGFSQKKHFLSSERNPALSGNRRKFSLHPDRAAFMFQSAIATFSARDKTGRRTRPCPPREKRNPRRSVQPLPVPLPQRNRPASPPPVPAGGSFRQPEPYFDSYGVITWNTASGPSLRAPPLP